HPGERGAVGGGLSERRQARRVPAVADEEGELAAHGRFRPAEGGVWGTPRRASNWWRSSWPRAPAGISTSTVRLPFTTLILMLLLSPRLRQLWRKEMTPGSTLGRTCKTSVPSVAISTALAPGGGSPSAGISTDSTGSSRS